MKTGSEAAFQRSCRACGATLVRREDEKPYLFRARTTCGKRAGCAGRTGFVTRTGETPEDRYWSLVDKRAEDDCWIWTGYINPGGYGQLGTAKAHHLALTLAGRPTPAPGLHVDHLCRNRSCVNPRHLEVVTPRENALRGESPNVLLHRSGVCKRGHDLAVHAYQKPGGGRQCRLCMNLRRKGALT